MLFRTSHFINSLTLDKSFGTPKTQSQKNKDSMMGGGGASPLPTKPDQAGGAGMKCGKCGHWHKVGSICSFNKSCLDDLAELLKANPPGVKRRKAKKEAASTEATASGIPGHKGGNPYHDEGGQFTTKENAVSRTTSMGAGAAPVNPKKDPTAGSGRDSDVESLLEESKTQPSTPEFDTGESTKVGIPEAASAARKEFVASGGETPKQLDDFVNKYERDPEALRPADKGKQGVAQPSTPEFDTADATAVAVPKKVSESQKNIRADVQAKDAAAAAAKKEAARKYSEQYTSMPELSYSGKRTEAPKEPIGKPAPAPESKPLGPEAGSEWDAISPGVGGPISDITSKQAADTQVSPTFADTQVSQPPQEVAPVREGPSEPLASGRLAVSAAKDKIKQDRAAAANNDDLGGLMGSPAQVPTKEMAQREKEFAPNPAAEARFSKQQERNLAQQAKIEGAVAGRQAKLAQPTGKNKDILEALNVAGGAEPSAMEMPTFGPSPAKPGTSPKQLQANEAAFGRRVSGIQAGQQKAAAQQQAAQQKQQAKLEAQRAKEFESNPAAEAKFEKQREANLAQQAKREGIAAGRQEKMAQKPGNQDVLGDLAAAKEMSSGAPAGAPPAPPSDQGGVNGLFDLTDTSTVGGPEFEKPSVPMPGSANVEQGTPSSPAGMPQTTQQMPGAQPKGAATSDKKKFKEMQQGMAVQGIQTNAQKDKEATKQQAAADKEAAATEKQQAAMDKYQLKQGKAAPTKGLPISQMYGAGAGIGASMTQDAGVVGPTAAFAAQRAHQLLNPDLRPHTAPSFAGTGMGARTKDRHSTGTTAATVPGQGSAIKSLEELLGL